MNIRISNKSVFGFVFHATNEKRGKQKHNLKIKRETSESEGEKGGGWAECVSEWKCENAKWLSPRTQINSKGEKTKRNSVCYAKAKKTKQNRKFRHSFSLSL